MMKNASFHALLLILITSVFTVQADTITSVGMSDRAGGFSFNKDLATASANEFLAEQASVATFRYDRKKNKTVFEHMLKSELRNVKTIRMEHYGKDGAIVWLRADTDTPHFVDEHCMDVKESLGSGEETDRIALRLLEDTIPDLLSSSLKKNSVIGGVSYLRNLSIKKNWFGKFKLKTEVCVAQLKSMSETQ